MDIRNTDPSAGRTVPSEKENSREAVLDSQLLDLVPFEVGNRIFAVFADQVDGTAEGKVPAPLPRAPVGVLGVVCVRGRMLTVLDPIGVLTGEALTWPDRLPSVIALRGDEQMALAAHRCRDTITTANADIQPSEDPSGESGNPVLGLVRHGGEEITVLNVERLFGAAMRRRERRRRRF